MRLYFLISILWLATFYTSAKGQNVEEFQRDYEFLVQNDFPKKSFDRLYEKHNTILFWFNPVSGLYASLSGLEVNEFPLTNFKNEDIYQQTIDLLLNDTSFNKQQLGSFLVCAANDTLRIASLRHLLKENDTRYFWTAVHHVLLAPKDIETILQFIKANEKDIELAHGLDYFFLLDDEVLSEFGIQHIYSENAVLQHLAIRSLAEGANSAEKQDCIRQAIDRLPLISKGWAIALAAHYQMSDMLALVKPYLENDTLALQEVSFRALAASPTPNDAQYLYDEARKQDELQTTPFLHLVESPQKDNLHRAFDLLELNKPVSPDFYFNFNNVQHTLKDGFLERIHRIVEKDTSEKILNGLIGSLSGFTDDETTAILISFLNHRSENLRMSAAVALVDNPSEKLRLILPSLIQHTSLSNFRLVDLAISLSMDDFQQFYKNALVDSALSHWEKSQAFLYLSTFPDRDHAEIFRTQLRKQDADDYIRNRQAAAALGKITDTESIDLIIHTSEVERLNSDFNCGSYIDALSLMKNEQTFEYIRSFIRSNEVIIRDRVSQLIAQW